MGRIRIINRRGLVLDTEVVDLETGKTLQGIETIEIAPLKAPYNSDLVKATITFIGVELDLVAEKEK